jgi:hypothetical protein
MQRWMWWVVAVFVILTADRALLALETRGYIHYRRHGLNLDGARYHAMEMHTIFEPAVQQVLQVSYRGERRYDDSGDPPYLIDPAKLT